MPFSSNASLFQKKPALLNRWLRFYFGNASSRTGSCRSERIILLGLKQLSIWLIEEKGSAE